MYSTMAVVGRASQVAQTEKKGHHYCIVRTKLTMRVNLEFLSQEKKFFPFFFLIKRREMMDVTKLIVDAHVTIQVKSLCYIP